MGETFQLPMLLCSDRELFKTQKWATGQNPREMSPGSAGFITLSSEVRPQDRCVATSPLGLPLGLPSLLSAQLTPLPNPGLLTSPDHLSLASLFDSPPTPHPQGCDNIYLHSWRIFSCHLLQQVAAVFIMRLKKSKNLWLRKEACAFHPTLGTS